MAFSKIAGFDVTPPKSSSSTSRFSSPPAIRLRRMKSSQTDWPYCRSTVTGFWIAEGRDDMLMKLYSCGAISRSSTAKVTGSSENNPVSARSVSSTVTNHGSRRSGLPTELFFRDPDHVLRLESEFFLELLERGGRPEGRHSD